MTKEDPPPRPARRRSGSQKRRKSAAIRVACLPSEKEHMRLLAERTGHSLGALCLNKLLDVPLPPLPSRPQTSEERHAIGLLLAELGATKGELGKIGSNLNQIARHYNAGRDPESERTAQAVVAALQDTERGLAMLDEMWRACMEAVGKRKGGDA